MPKTSALVFSSWNIQGSCCKTFKDDEFLSYVENSDIICVQETWLDSYVDLDIPGYSFFTSSRIRSKGAKRNSGGVAVIFKSLYRRGISKLVSSTVDTVWCKFDKQFFGLENDLYLCNAYIPPESSSKSSNESPFEILSNDICKYSNLGDIVVLGDLNARTGQLIENHFDTFTFDNPITDGLCFTKNRQNRDIKVNNYGKTLIDLCSAADLTILNGRFAGDLKGDFTCYHYNGSSVVDYCIVRNSLLSDVQYVNVSPISEFSDHCHVSFSLSTNYSAHFQKATNQIKPKPTAFIWTDESKSIYQSILDSRDTISKFQNFCQTSFCSTEKSVTNFTELLLDVAKKSLKTKPNKQTKKPAQSGKKNKVWFDQCCWSSRQRLKRLSLALKKEPWLKEIRSKYFTALRDYKKLIKQRKQKYNSDLLAKLEEFNKNNPKEFWSLLKYLDKEISGKHNKNTCDPNITSEEWIHHFTSLNNLINDSSFDTVFEKTVTEYLNQLDDHTPNPLDFPFTPVEVLNGLKLLKTGKASGIDSISNEMLKYGAKHLCQPLVSLFNTILDKGTFPSNWNTSILTPIHKSGDKSNADNYRGIAISSCLSKLFTLILNNRLQNFAERNKILDDTQFGFRKRCRTSDNVFILKSLIDKYTNKKGGKLFVCFVDMRKAFDSVWRDGLFYKLHQCGIGGNCFNIIKSM